MKNNIVENQEFENAGANESGSGAFEAFRSGAVPLPAAKKCANPWCNKQFIPLNGHQKYCSEKCAAFIHERQKHNCAIKKTQYVCENCGNEHDGSYGSGRFCSKMCSNEYIASTKRNANNPKVKAHLDELRLKGIIGQRSPYGTWKCEECQLVFETRAKLFQHQHEIHAKVVFLPNSTNKYECPFCNREFDSVKKAIGHLHGCKKHPNKEKHDIAYKQGGKTYSKRLKNGLVQPSFKGKKHSEKSRKKMRIAAANYLKTIRATPCRYNKSSIAILENIAKEHGWNIQHAENGGEFYTGIGYFVDAYDKEKNIVLEFDEAAHYIDAENNALCNKDIKRQKEIIEHLHCEYWRFNSVTNVLWKVI